LRLAVIIINYNSANLVLDCLDSLHASLDEKQDTLIIVDNASQKADLEELKLQLKLKWHRFSNIKLIESNFNGGFSTGNNIGIKNVRADHYLLANADTLFQKDAVNGLLKAAKKHPEAGIFSPRLEWPDGTPQISCFRFHSPLSELIDSAGTAFITKLLKNFNVPLAVQSSQSTPEWTSFASIMIRKEVFDAIGLMDEDFFMYYEDVDFCRRARENGFSVVNCPDSHVVHLRGQTSGMKKKVKENKRLPEYYYHSRSRYFKKHFSTVGFWLANLLWMTGFTIGEIKRVLFRKEHNYPKYKWLDIWKR